MFIPYLLPLLSVLASALPASAKRGGGRGGFDISINFELTSIDAAQFSFFIFYAVCSAFQIYYAALVFKARIPQEEIPNRMVSAFLVTFTAVLLTTYYILGSVIVGVDRNVRGSSYPLDVAVYAVADFFYQLLDVLIFLFLLLHTIHRRNAYIRQNQHILTPQEIQRQGSPMIYRNLPLFALGMLGAINFVQLGIYLSYEDATTKSIRKLSNAMLGMNHLYLAFYILSVIHLVVSTWTLRTLVHRNPSYNYALFDQNVLLPLFKVACSCLVIMTVYRFITHLVFYVPSNFYPDSQAVRLVTLILGGFLNALILGTAIGFGRIPKPKEDESEEERARKAKA